MFNFLNFGSTAKYDYGAGDAEYTRDELLGAYRNLTYQECQNLFRFWPLGKRLVEALPNFAMSAPREFSFGEYTSDDLTSRIESMCKELQVDKVVKTTAMNARIYGMASIFVAYKGEGLSPKDAIRYEDCKPNMIVLNPLDPLSMGANIQVDLNPLSPSFQAPTAVTIRGEEVNPKRVAIVYNDIPLYLKFNPSSFSFTGQSIFQNATLLIRTFNRTMIALQRAATKAGSIVRTTKEVSHNSGISYQALAKNNEMIRCMENDGIAAIGSGEQVTLFDINNIQQVGDIITKVNEMFMMALNDTPGGILLDKNLSFGLNDGSEDMKSILMAIEHFRDQILKPLYDFCDHYVLATALSPDWLAGYVKERSDKFAGKGPQEVYQILLQNYSFKFGEIYPLNAVEKEDRNSKVLENLKALKELGVTTADIEALLNQSEIYNIDFVLEEPVDVNAIPNEEGEDETDQQGGATNE